MSSSNENKVDETTIFKWWAATVRKDKSLQYKYGERKRHIEDLVGALHTNGISQDDAEMLKKRVVETLVTKEGMKGRDEHKGWKENVALDFDDAIQIAYVSFAKPIVPLKNAQGYDPLIVNWCKKKYGENVGDQILIAAHQPLHLLWMMCINETFKRNTGGRL